MAELPQLQQRLFLTDGGLETCLIFHDHIDLPHFAAFDLLRTAEGREALVRYYEPFLRLAVENGTGFILESPTWRASPDWGARLGYGRDELARANRDAIALLGELKARHETPDSPMVLSGCVGPRGDGYDPGEIMSDTEAQAYHAFQAEEFAEAGADMITAITMTNVPEATGVARAAGAVGLPCALSFTVETDGSLPTGTTLGDAVGAVDAATEGAPAYYMINCAHPTHFAHVLDTDEPWTKRLRGLRTNASKLSHAELDEAEELDDGDPEELGRENAALVARLPHLNILGGCCGTDLRHVTAMHAYLTGHRAAA